MRHNGFTLFELLITLLVVSLLLTVGVPSFSNQTQNVQIKTATNDLLTAIEMTRSLAVFKNKRTVIKTNHEWTNGWDIFVDANNNGLLDPNETIATKHEVFKGIRFIANKPLNEYISFIGTGESRMIGGATTGAFQSGTIKICPIKPGSGVAIILARGGRARATEIPPEACRE